MRAAKAVIKDSLWVGQEAPVEDVAQLKCKTAKRSFTILSNGKLVGRAFVPEVSGTLQKTEAVPLGILSLPKGETGAGEIAAPLKASNQKAVVGELKEAGYNVDDVAPTKIDS